MIKEYDPVIAAKDVSNEIVKGGRGIVVWVYDTLKIGYEVEFMSDSNHIIAVLTVNPYDITP